MPYLKTTSDQLYTADEPNVQIFISFILFITICVALFSTMFINGDDELEMCLSHNKPESEACNSKIVAHCFQFVMILITTTTVKSSSNVVNTLLIHSHWSLNYGQ